MKLNIFKYLLILSTIFVLSSCEDFFKVETDNTLGSGDYIATDSEMYAGYIGIMTKVQAIGDKIIYITDTRGELLEPTVNASSELYSLYNYDTDLKGNSYADPAPYYDVIIACNDYLDKMIEYRKSNASSIDNDHFKALVSSALRVKAWVYLTIGKIYGEAVWFDDPMREKEDLSKFPVKNLKEIVVECKTLLETGVEGIDGSLSMSWHEWLDPETPLGDSKYRYWEGMTPEYFALYAELCLWNGDYQKVLDLILPKLHEKFASTATGTSIDWLRSSGLPGAYARTWRDKQPYRIESVSAIIYDAKYNQTNSLMKHFRPEAPNNYQLAPSEAGRARFSDPDFNNLGTQISDGRAGVTFGTNAGQWVINKYRFTDPGSNTTNRREVYEDDIQIYIYRGSELHFMLSEALNQLGRYPEAAGLINIGVGGTFPSGGVDWVGFNDDWTSATQFGSRQYPNAGIRGCFSLGNREFFKEVKKPGDPYVKGEESLTDVATAEEAKKRNDLAILDEMLLEFPVEGRIYPAMIRMAQRYNDYNIIADRVTPKYSNPEEIKDKILDGGYFIKWDLKNK